MSKHVLKTERVMPRTDLPLDDAGTTPRDAETIALAAPRAVAGDALKARLFASLERTNRFDDLEARVAELADVSIERARALLLAVDAPGTAWEPTAIPGVSIFHFEGGPKVQNAVTGFIKHAPGAAFPEHDHVEGEHVLVLQGAFETEGRIVRAGEVDVRPSSSPHGYRAVGPLPLVTMAIVQGGVILGGEIIPPRDPRA